MEWKERITALPEGYSEVVYQNRRYGVSKTLFNRGQSVKIYANELGGKDFISFNYYVTSHERLLKPCEMPKLKVLDFLEKFEKRM